MTVRAKAKKVEVRVAERMVDDESEGLFSVLIVYAAFDSDDLLGDVTETK